MQPVHKQSRGLVCWLTLGMVLFSSQACSEGGGKITLPAKTQMVLAVGQDGSVVVLDASGIPAPKCQFCTQEMEKTYGPYCKEAPAKAEICAGLTGVTVQDVKSATILTTRMNPLCSCGVIGGFAYCLPKGCSAQR